MLAAGKTGAFVFNCPGGSRNSPLVIQRRSSRVWIGVLAKQESNSRPGQRSVQWISLTQTKYLLVKIVCHSR